MEDMKAKVQLPVFKNMEYDIEAYSAIGDGITLNTEAINQAITECSEQGGGYVIVPAGMWLTGPIELKSNVNLHLEDGAVILFSRDYSLYPLILSNYEGFETARCTSPLNAKDAENIAITGRGVIEGNGDAWRLVKKWKVTNKQWDKLLRSGGVVDSRGNENDLWFPTQAAMDGRDYDNGHGNKCNNLEECEQYKEFFRPVLLNFVGCNKVLLEGVTFQNSAAWCLHPRLCENLTIKNVQVRNPWFSSNGDGLDIESCKYVNVLDSVFDVGDDAICIKSGKNEEGRALGKPTQYVTIDNCRVYHGHGGFVVGSEMSGGAKDISVTNCTFLGTDVGLRFKSCLGRGGVVENITVKNINMTNIVDEAIIITTGYGINNSKKGQQVEPEEVPEFRNIHIENVQCTAAGKAIILEGLEEMSIKNITLKNVAIKGNKGIDIKLSENIIMEHVNVSNTKDSTQKVEIEQLTVNGEYITEF
jgi:polygalacturonase